MAKKYDIEDSLKAAMQVPKTEHKFKTEERENMIRINIRMSQRLRDDVEAAAQLSDLSFSEYIRKTIREAAARDLSR